MDPLQPKELENDNSGNIQSKFMASDKGEVCLQLEGSHITSTDTEDISLNGKEKKIIQFEDELSEFEMIKGECTENIKREVSKVGQLLEDEKPGLKEGTLDNTRYNLRELENILNENLDSKKFIEEPKDAKNLLMVKVNHLDQSKSKQTGQENLEIAYHFHQIMAMFENFSKNLESLDLEVTPQTSNEILLNGTKRKSTKDRHDDEKTKKQQRYSKKQSADQQENLKETAIKRYENCTNSQELEIPAQMDQLITPTSVAAGNMESPLTYSISTNTSFCIMTTDKKSSHSLGCQTLPSDHFSLNDFNLLDISSTTSHSEPVNSLNNYAQAENALDLHKQPQIYPTQKSFKIDFKEIVINSPIETYNQCETLSQIVVEQSLNQNVHTIHIEENATPSSSNLRRPPLCQRLWSVICDFCAATYLCLQVNRDCIFCLGFFAAFVVTASFLTAFFYHTLSINLLL